MGIVNMVRLLKLLFFVIIFFFIYLVPPVLVGFLNIRLVLHVILWFLEKKKKKQKFGVFFISLGYFQFSPLVACWGDIEASEQIE